MTKGVQNMLGLYVGHFLKLLLHNSKFDNSTGVTQKGREVSWAGCRPSKLQHFHAVQLLKFAVEKTHWLPFHH